MHRERHAVLVRETIDGVGNLRGSERAFGGFKSAVLRQVQVVEVVGGVGDGGRTGATAVVVDENVAHDGEHPSFEIGVLGILCLVVKRFEGGVLQKVVSVVAVTCEHVGKVQQIALKSHQVVLKFLGSHSDKFDVDLWIILFAFVMYLCC